MEFLFSLIYFEYHGKGHVTVSEMALWAYNTLETEMVAGTFAGAHE